MKQILQYLAEFAQIILPFLKKRDTKKVQEFSDLITGQYTFLVAQLDKVLKDYFEVSEKVREMHAELFSLKAELHKAVMERCKDTTCKERE